jgi:excisionase family DNA binding protein
MILINRTKSDSASKFPNANKVLLRPDRRSRSKGESIRSSKSVLSLRLLTVEQFRREAQIGRATAYKLIASGEIPHVRIGSRIIRIPLSALENLAEYCVPIREDRFT